MRAWIIVAVMAYAATARAGDHECAAPSTCRPLCTAGDVDACTWLGEYYETGPDMSASATSTAIGQRLLEAACAKGGAEACDALASTILHAALQDLVDPDQHRIAELRATACKGGFADACDAAQRVRLLEAACTASDAAACLMAGRFYDLPGTKHPEDDDSGGTGTAMALDNGPRKPPVVAPDAKKAKALRARGLLLIDQACAHGKARTCNAAPGRSKPALELACKAGSSEACMRRAFFDVDMLDAPNLAGKQSADVLQYLTRGCELADLVACAILADAYRDGGHGIKPDPAKAHVFEQKACDAHDVGTCTILAKRSDEGTGVAKDPVKALAMFRHACDEGEPYACMQVADSLAAGTRGATKDLKLAIELYARSCELETFDIAVFRDVCTELAKRYDAGDGVAKDAAKAKQLRARGCVKAHKKCAP